MWFAGGSTASVPSRQVWRSTTGIDWTLVGQLPLRRSNGALVSWRDQLLYIAGTDGSPVATVYASPDGVTWSTHTSTFPQPRQGGAAAVFTPR